MPRYPSKSLPTISSPAKAGALMGWRLPMQSQARRQLASAEWLHISSRYKPALGVTIQCRDWKEESAWFFRFRRKEVGKRERGPSLLAASIWWTTHFIGPQPSSNAAHLMGSIPWGPGSHRRRVPLDCTATQCLRVTGKHNPSLLSASDSQNAWNTDHFNCGDA